VATKASRKPLSRERVLAAAVALADTQGIQALTMRRLAADLGVEAMSLYYHLPDKEALLDGVAETVIAEIWAAVGRLGASGGDQNWRTKLRQQFLAARHVMLRHPWAPGLLGSRRTIPAGVYTYPVHRQRNPPPVGHRHRPTTPTPAHPSLVQLAPTPPTPRPPQPLPAQTQRSRVTVVVPVRLRL
jgi:AcrR family transcriptional regulator